MSNKGQINDERLVRSAGAAVRGDRAEADTDRLHKDGASLSPEERRALLRQDWAQEILPKIPKMPGYHLCWVSTTNSADPIYRRIQRGYLPVKASDIPGFGEQFAVRGGDFDGVISCNEMLLFKIPEEIFIDMMTIFHHDIPLEQEQSIKERMRDTQEIDRNNQRLIETEGFDKLGQTPARRPTFAS